MTTFYKIAGRRSPDGIVWYVESLPGQGGACYGYTQDPKKAAPLSRGMIDRFFAYIGSFSADVVFESLGVEEPEDQPA